MDLCHRTLEAGRLDRQRRGQLVRDQYADLAARQALYRRTFAALKSIRGVVDAGAAVVVPLTGNNWTVPFERVDRPVLPGERPPEVGWQSASGGFFTSLRVPLLAGRLFDDRDAAGPPVVIISQAIARRYFEGESAVGKYLNTGDGPVEIVGVVGDIRRAALTDEPRADTYFPFEHFPSPQITFFIRTSGDPLRLVPDMRRALRDVEPAAVVDDIRTMSDIANDSMQVTRLALWMLGLFAATALTLAAVGIYGVMSYAVRQRTQEIGTRMALGATRGRIVWLMMRNGLAVTGAGAAIGLAAGLIAARSLISILYRISPTDAGTAVAAVLVLAIPSLVACYLPARRAASLDPARTLMEQ